MVHSTTAYIDSALSYTWGSKKRSMNVKVNGFLLGVRMNLHNFLMIMQKDTQFCETKLLWIDQICIDQSNVRERNHQVGQMSEIYKTAAEVLIWLGPGTSHSRSLVMAIDNFYGFNTPPDRICALKFQRLFKASQFLNLPYWSRLWIIQEVLLARCLRITWGIDRLDWVKLDFLIKGLIFGGHLANAGVDDGLGSNSKDHLQRLVEARQHDRQKDGNYRYSWHGALALAEYTDCQDPRDRIYGLLGLLDPSQAIQPDYTKPLYQVFDEMMAVAPDRTTNRIVRYI